MPAAIESEDGVGQQLARARALSKEGKPLDAERAYQNILSSTVTVFGQRSSMVASVLCEMAAFYAAQEKPCSAKEFTEAAFAIMRW